MFFDIFCIHTAKHVPGYTLLPEKPKPQKLKALGNNILQDPKKIFWNIFFLALLVLNPFCAVLGRDKTRTNTSDMHLTDTVRKLFFFISDWLQPSLQKCMLGYKLFLERHELIMWHQTKFGYRSTNWAIFLNKVKYSKNRIYCYQTKYNNRVLWCGTRYVNLQCYSLNKHLLPADYQV